MTKPAECVDVVLRNVEDDGTVAPVDVLLVINRPARTGTGLAPNAQITPARYFDIDGFIAPLDVLLVINTLNRRPDTGEGEPLNSVADLSESKQLHSEHCPIEFYDGSKHRR